MTDRCHAGAVVVGIDAGAARVAARPVPPATELEGALVLSDQLGALAGPDVRRFVRQNER
ncbi:MAG: hypothetical protein CSA66_01825 [Proteobacteria bacterium]|nr:MAG: hypothetical protein CSA66_01825 [Pseudomonadota bacterium]